MAVSGRSSYMTIGQVVERSGVPASALRFYESRGLIDAVRGPGNQRRFHRSTLRRISIIRIAQSLGLTLEEIARALESLPRGTNPTKKDWERLSGHWHSLLDKRINGLIRLRDQLGGCIGCGCLSMRNCALYNPRDKAADEGPGARFLLNDGE